MRVRGLPSSADESILSPKDFRGLAIGLVLGPPYHSLPPKIYFGEQSILGANDDSAAGISPCNIY